jgi:FAD synthase
MKKIQGIVKKGKGKGRKLGYPTVNLDINGIGVESGVYAGTVRICEAPQNTTPPPLRGTSPQLRGGSKEIITEEGRNINTTEERKIEEEIVYKAGVFVSRDKKTLEAHLIGFKGDLYGQEIEVEIGEKIREARNFGSEEELKRQIGKDLKRITDN